MLAVPIAVAKKVGTASIDLSDHRGIPQIPCPDVQPLAILVPSPTKNPPMTNPGQPSPDTELSAGGNVYQVVSVPIKKCSEPASITPSIMPQVLLSNSMNTFLKSIPLIPVSLPLKYKWMQVEIAMTTAPTAALIASVDVVMGDSVYRLRTRYQINESRAHMTSHGSDEAKG